MKFKFFPDVSRMDGIEICSGVLIDSCHVLTQAPCVANLNGSTNTTVFVGGPVPYAWNISHIKFNPDGPQQNKIALLTLEECVPVPTIADVICLPVHNEDITNQTATIMSFDVRPDPG